VQEVGLPAFRSAERVRVANDCGYFPVLVKAADGALVVVFRDGAAHMGKNGYLVAARSEDNGSTWSQPIVVVNSREFDDRNPSVGVAQDGTITVAYHANGSYGEKGEHIGDRRTPRALHTGIVHSNDHGRTWGDPMLWCDATPWDGMSPYGRMLTLHDGALIMPIYFDESYLLRSKNNGITWGELTLVGADVNETSFCVLPSGEWLCVGRKHNESEEQRLLVRHSSDNGYTWSSAAPLGQNRTLPADVVVLSDGSVLVVYGYRTDPCGARARLSLDGGHTWSETELILHDASLNRDCGYPSVVVNNGWVVVAFYDGGRTTHTAPDGKNAFCEVVRIPEAELIPVLSR
jgi:hypothetical protein